MLTLTDSKTEFKKKMNYLILKFKSCQVVSSHLIGLVSLFDGISTLFRLFNAKAILLEEQLWYYLTHSWEDKRVHTFPKGICLKVNVIAWLEYGLAYYNSAVHRFNHYTMRTSHLAISVWLETSFSYLHFDTSTLKKKRNI